MADPDAIVHLEGGPAPKDCKASVNATSREGRYACEHTLAALAARLERRSVVFAWHADTKHRIKGWVIRPPEGPGALGRKRMKAEKVGPIPLVLKVMHYTTLKLGTHPDRGEAEADWPLEWADEPAAEDVKLLVGSQAARLRQAGGGTRTSEPHREVGRPAHRRRAGRAARRRAGRRRQCEEGGGGG